MTFTGDRTLRVVDTVIVSENVSEGVRSRDQLLKEIQNEVEK